ncbi:S8 family serine peptidase [Leptothoe spongobia]|uniref:S8 family serine peptidase n=1 Tax=Leptothoe spongobia TAU-MAC 1115 TaxID=1967444 RepID=A0A947DBL9_9CYAN|nr:S8 family serine peptidase [Leptothoe spongobia]MBT9314206.1 S8 family serine peptidase [Leptothoe spongobia TAU-MAC 1115]
MGIFQQILDRSSSSYRHQAKHLWPPLALLIGLGAGIPALALSVSVGEDGIDARRLHQPPYNLTGKKIAIGQVEGGRPGLFGLDKISISNNPVTVTQVLQIDGPAIADEFVDDHANHVASVMVSQEKRLIGVAPDARLFSAAIGPLTGELSGQPQECLTSQHIALRNSGDVRAINFSFGEPLVSDPRPDASLDGNALLTQCVDWSSRVHKALYVIAGNQGGGGIPIPTDNFNGINVAYSTQVDGRFVKVDYANSSSEPAFRPRGADSPESNVGPRRSINLVAPGDDIRMLDPNGQEVLSSGSSFAAPHVAATVALLQEWGDRQIRTAGWQLDAREPMVMKAVLLNAADKLRDEGNGQLLGMGRTLLDESNLTWVDSDAYTDPKIPLHRELGTGHLNAFRAYEQFNGGQWGPGNVTVRGWDYNSLPLNTAETSDQHLAHTDYAIETPLKAGSYLAATLTWERQVSLEDSDDNGLYDIGESFDVGGLNNLNLYLMPIDEEDTSKSIWSSVSDVDSLEHIFYQIPKSGRYKLRVVYEQQVTRETLQPYALAWWGVAEAVAPISRAQHEHHSN